MTLQPKQFWYHASKADLTPGVDQILPSNVVGKAAYDYDNWDEAEPDGSHRGDFTFAADTEEEAEAWHTHAWAGRPTTYVVRPPEGAETAIETGHHRTRRDEGGAHLKAKGPMEIVDRIDIPAPAPGGVVQGTLPPIHWGKFAYPSVGPTAWAADARHMTPELRDPAITAIIEERRSQVEQQRRRDYESGWKAAGQQKLDL
jgi:hypothetical protein